MTDKPDTKSFARLLVFLRQKGPAVVVNDGERVTLRPVSPGKAEMACTASLLVTALKRKLVGAVRAANASACIRITDAGVAWLARQTGGRQAGEEDRIVVVVANPDDAAQTVSMNIAESPLSRLARAMGGEQAWLDADEFRAGERLRSDFEMAGLGQKVTSSWDAAHLSGAGGRGPSDGLSSGERAMDARRRVAKAMMAVGPEFSGVLMDVCCFLKGLEQVETERRWPRRSAKLLLKAGLSALDRHYYPAVPDAQMGRIRQWGAPGYRPDMASS